MGEASNRAPATPRRRGAVRGIVAGSIAIVAVLLGASPSLGATHVFRETFGAAEQPTFLHAEALAVDQQTHDLYVADVGVNELQLVNVSATAGKFILKFNGEATTSLEFNASAGSVQTALRALAPLLGVSVTGTPGNYTINFGGTLSTTDVPQLECENGSPPLSGGSGCAVSALTQGISSKVKRYHANGTPDNFSALGTNAIDNLVFAQGSNVNQIAIAPASAAGGTAGDFYVTQVFNRLVQVYKSTGEHPGDLTQFKEGPTASGSLKPFGFLACGVGADVSSVYTGDTTNNEIHKYIPSANPVVNGDNVANFSSAPGPCAVAPGAGPTAGFVFVVRNGSGLYKVNTTTGALQYQVDPREFTTVTVDPVTGHLLAAKGSEILEYDASGATEAKLLSTTTVASKVEGIAVDGSTGDLYVARAGNSKVEVYEAIIAPEVVTLEANPVGSGTATLKGTVNPEGLALKANSAEGCFFEWGETTSYGNVAPCEAPNSSEVGAGSSPVSVHASISGLKVGAEYHFRLRAANAKASAAPGADKSFITVGPIISGSTVSGVSASAAQVSGFVNPHGVATSFEVRYVSQAQFEISGWAEATSLPSPPKALGSGTTAIAVAQQLSGLAPGTVYRAQIIAESSVTAEGPALIFSTLAAPLGALADGRAYEQVTPAAKQGEPYPPEPAASIGVSCIQCLPGFNNQMMPMQASADGNSILYAGQPFVPGTASGPNEYLSQRGVGGWGTQSLSLPLFAVGSDQGYVGFAEGSTRGVLFQVDPILSDDAPSREGIGFANLYMREAGGSLAPLVTEEPPNRAPGTHSSNLFLIHFAGANAGAGSVGPYTHVIFEANDALTDPVPAIAPAPLPISEGEICRLQEFSCNRDLYEWSGGQLHLVNVLPGNTAATFGVIGSGLLLGEVPAVDHAISDDGSRIFWSSLATGQLYVREGGTTTIPVLDPGKFLTANSSGSEVLLSNGHIYSLEAEATIEDLTDGLGGFKGILGTSEDLARIYFVDAKVLTGAEENANHETAVDTQNNLYYWNEGVTRFVGRLDSGDNVLGGLGTFGDWKASRSARTAQVSADGRYLAFMSRARLTGYDNRLASENLCFPSTTSACSEVFLYNAATAKLVCASCNPSSQRPLGNSNLNLINPRFGYPPFRQPGNLTANGRLFFESQDVLSADDVNGRIQDVYEWEPNGIGSCTQTAGCVYLISSGSSTFDSTFLDATPGGNDAFFITRQQLLPRDQDDMLDVYDARVGGGFKESTTAPCAGDACRGTLSVPPSLPGPPAFNGPGNPKPAKKCKPNQVKKNGKCVAKQKKKHHKGKGKKKRAGAEQKGGAK